MKTAALVLVTLVLCAAPTYPGALGSYLDLSLSARGKLMTGHTMYTIDFSKMYLIQGYNVVVNSTSELKFPLDVFVTEYAFSLGGKLTKNLPWSLNVSYAANTNDPGDAMTDLDWWRVPLLEIDDLVSSTDSKAQLDAEYFNIYWKAAVWAGSGIRFDALLGYEYQKLSFDMTGVTGWQLDSLERRVYFSELEGELVGTYEVKYHIPYAGIAATIDIIRELDIDATVKASPLVSAKDRDDHVLRDKLSSGDVTGGMVAVGGEASYTLFGPGQGLSWVFSFGYEYTYINATGSQTQTWYGDDPFYPGDETGTQVTGIGDKLKSEQQGLSLAITLRF